jgi:hypothetical protein
VGVSSFRPGSIAAFQESAQLIAQPEAGGAQRVSDEGQRYDPEIVKLQMVSHFANSTSLNTILPEFIV